MNFRSIAARLMAPLVVSMLLMAALAGVTMHSQSRIEAADKAAMEAHQHMADLLELRSISRSLQRDAANFLWETDFTEMQTIRSKFAEHMEQLVGGLEKLKAAPAQSGLSPDYFSTQDHVVRALGVIVQYANSGDMAGAANAFRHGLRPAERASSKIADARIKELGKQIEVLQATASAVTAQAQIVLIAATILLSIAGLAAGFVITRRSVVRPLHELRASMAELAKGNTHLAIPHEGRADEVGQMAQSMVIFRNQLAEAERAKEQQATLIVNSIGNGLDALARGDLSVTVDAELTGPFAKLKTDFNRAVTELGGAMRSVIAATHNINTSANEIRHASSDLSHRTEEQAASLQETASAMAEITTTIRQTAEGATRANSVVSQTRVEAEHSGDVVRRTIGAMSGIERASAEIAEIISVIDGIAYQTNLLALNAGVEAARAGEAGRGFAVVASEVRALAQRSADAATDVKSRIMASTHQVETGVALVSETGKTLGRIVERVSEISELVEDIARSADRQAATLQQVNATVSDIDAVTQQNAAMVEEATAAARSLAGEADSLARNVAHFRLSGSATPIRRTASAAPAPRAPAVRQAPRSMGNLAVAQDDEDWTEF